jgi:hypothetical protein
MIPDVWRNSKPLQIIELTDMTAELTGAMETTGEPPVQRRFEMREGIEMVPGTVYLVDGKSICHRAGCAAAASIQLGHEEHPG